MKFKGLLLGAALVLLLATPSYSFVSECYEEECALPSAGSASEFLLDDLNSLPEIDDFVSFATDGQFWPTEGIVTGHFGKWRGGRRSGHYHAGVDIAAPTGTPIVAPFEGVVTFTGRKGGYGLTVIIDHGDGVATLYGHNSNILVSEGQRVEKGDLISKVGSTGRSSGPHLHYEVRKEGSPVNPLTWTAKLQTLRAGI